MAIQLGSIENCHGNYGNWGPIARSIGIQIAIIDRAIMAIGGAWNRGAIEFQLPKLGGQLWQFATSNWGQIGGAIALIGVNWGQLWQLP